MFVAGGMESSENGR